MAAFLAGTANAFSITLGERRNHITQDALSFFAQDSITVSPSLTVDLGLRYEWHVTPTERDNQFVVFDAATASLLRVGVDVDKIYRQNNDNIEPRLGFAWTLGGDGRTVLRAAYGWAVDQPGTTAVNGTTRQSAVRDAADRHRRHSAGQRRQPHAADRPRADDRRSGVAQRLAALVECQRAAPARRRPGRDGRATSARTARICASRATSTSR